MGGSRGIGDLANLVVERLGSGQAEEIVDVMDLAEVDGFGSPANASLVPRPSGDYMGRG